MLVAICLALLATVAMGTSMVVVSRRNQTHRLGYFSAPAHRSTAHYALTFGTLVLSASAFLRSSDVGTSNEAGIVLAWIGPLAVAVVGTGLHNRRAQRGHDESTEVLRRRGQ